MLPLSSMEFLAMRQSDYDYYAEREQIERVNAARAVDPMVRDAHQAMADIYAERLKAASRRRPLLSP
ncbi:hypothetical protein [Sphingomonas sp.]|uniref:hypothetical protein n=2 Tax=unclassified Sphingomonas TaxID=196159 RepID=UPI00307D30E8